MDNTYYEMISPCDIEIMGFSLDNEHGVPGYAKDEEVEGPIDYLTLAQGNLTTLYARSGHVYSAYVANSSALARFLIETVQAENMLRGKNDISLLK